ncbi:hypothetical protein ABMA70_09420 [Halobacteriovorax sp. XZX-3]|uniref:hypothetical protein n=1 Tax=unclassified Halobacteriovorax TaxID=2639665 RepID=UPI0037206F1E
MKYIIIIFAMFSVYASGGVIGGTDTLAPAGKSGVIGDVDTLRILPSVIDIQDTNSFSKDKLISTLMKTGDFDFDSVNDRWILKTRDRILSVNSIELIEKYNIKQDEVTITKDNILNNYKRSIPKRLLERQLKRNVKFKNYIINDFEY